MHVNLIKLKIKSKSLEAEAAIIRKEMRNLIERGLRGWEDYGSLHYHLTQVVSVEARATFIARAYLSGKPFSVIERYVYDDEGKKTFKLKNDLSTYSVFMEREGRQKEALRKAKNMVKNYQGKVLPKFEDFDDWVKLR